jgi:large conductance mechanosensitive channel
MLIFPLYGGRAGGVKAKGAFEGGRGGGWRIEDGARRADPGESALTFILQNPILSVDSFSTLNPRNPSWPCSKFKEFAMRKRHRHGRRIIIGAAFGKIVSSLVNDVLMPPIGMLMGNMDFSNLAVSLKDPEKLADGTMSKAVTMNYGMFINSVIDFVIIAFVIFMLIKQINRLKRAKSEDPITRECRSASRRSPQATRCPQCTSELSPS